MVILESALISQYTFSNIAWGISADLWHLMTKYLTSSTQFKLHCRQYVSALFRLHLYIISNRYNHIESIAFYKMNSQAGYKKYLVIWELTHYCINQPFYMVSVGIICILPIHQAYLGISHEIFLNRI